MSWPCRVCNLATWNDRSTCRGCDQAKPSTAKTKTAPGKGKGQQKTSSASVDVSASSKSRVAIIKEEQTIAEARDRPLGEQSLEVLKAARPEAKTSRAALSVTTPGGDHASPGEPHRGLAQGAGREEAPRQEGRRPEGGDRARTERRISEAQEIIATAQKTLSAEQTDLVRFPSELQVVEGKLLDEGRAASAVPAWVETKVGAVIMALQRGESPTQAALISALQNCLTPTEDPPIAAAASFSAAATAKDAKCVPDPARPMANGEGDDDMPLTELWKRDGPVSPVLVPTAHRLRSKTPHEQTVYAAAAASGGG